MINFQELSKVYNVKKIEKSDIREILDLFKGNPNYFFYSKEDSSNEFIESEMGNLPDNKKPEDKYYLGYFLKDSLIAVLDLVENFPSSKICFIGFFMLKKELQGKGIASKIIRELENELEKNKFKKIMLGYV